MGAKMTEESLPDRVILTTQFGQYDVAAFDGTNHSGLQPLCDKVLVLCDRAAPETEGGILLPDTSRESTTMAAITGVLIAAGPQAFAYDSHRLVHWEGARPQPGDRVFFQKYAGFEYFGRDGQMYRIMEDRQIAAIETPADDGGQMTAAY